MTSGEHERSGGVRGAINELFGIGDRRGERDGDQDETVRTAPHAEGQQQAGAEYAPTSDTRPGTTGDPSFGDSVPSQRRGGTITDETVVTPQHPAGDVEGSGAWQSGTADAPARADESLSETDGPRHELHDERVAGQDLAPQDHDGVADHPAGATAATPGTGPAAAAAGYRQETTERIDDRADLGTDDRGTDYRGADEHDGHGTDVRGDRGADYRDDLGTDGDRGTDYRDERGGLGTGERADVPGDLGDLGTADPVDRGTDYRDDRGELGADVPVDRGTGYGDDRGDLGTADRGDLGTDVPVDRGTDYRDDRDDRGTADRADLGTDYRADDLTPATSAGVSPDVRSGPVHDGDATPVGPGTAAPATVTSSTATAADGPDARTGSPASAGTDEEGRERLVPAQRASEYGTRWDQIKGEFVDEPRRAVAGADALVGELLDELQSLFAQQRQGLDHGLDADETSTEDLRLALRRYRSFFDRLLSI